MRNIQAFSLIELILVIAIIVILTAVLTPLVNSEKYALEAETQKLLVDIRQAQQFAMAQENSYSYYGISFFANLGPSNNRCGYKIERYEPVNVALPISVPPNVPTIVKSALATDNPLILDEDLFFDSRVTFDANSEIGPHNRNQKRIVFTLVGSATTDGNTLITVGTSDTITLKAGGFQHSITIAPVTGYAEIN